MLLHYQCLALWPLLLSSVVNATILLSVLVPMNSKIAIFNWNVRGLNSVKRREEVSKLLHSCWPVLVCLQESKLEQISDQLVTKFLEQHLSKFSYLSVVGVSGGIILARDDDVSKASYVSLKEFSLTATVNLCLTYVSFVITLVYGPTLGVDKPYFFDELKAIELVEDQLWLCLRYFNLIYSAQDKNNMNLSKV
jgi:hypothetical protein